MSDAGRTSMLRRLAQRPAASGDAVRADAGEVPDEVERAQLREMIERKRRNDLVRKRELDMLRRVRHEGLTPEQAAALDAPISLPGELEPAPVANGDRMRAKIDEIEQAMVGLTGGALRPPMLTRPVTLDAPSTVHAHAEVPLTRSPATQAPQAAPAAEQRPPEINDMRHDPVLDVAVMAFAGGDVLASERELRALIDGPCAQDADTWLVLADLYRATGQQGPFDTLALAFSATFNRSPPQWFSLPELVAADRLTRGSVTVMPDVPAWTAPAQFDDRAAAALRSHSEQHPAPWVINWSGVRSVTPTGAQGLVGLAQFWGTQAATLHWRGVPALLTALEAATPTGQREVQPVLWLARLAVLRLVGRSQAFETVAIDYCVTYEVSPPSWEPVRCRLQADSAQNDATTAMLTEPPGSQLSATPLPDEIVLPMVGVWSGDMGATLCGWTDEALMAPAARLVVNGALLARIDFTAAGDVLNWIVARRGEGRDLRFVDLHRLTALMLSVMGVNEHVPLFMRRA